MHQYGSFIYGSIWIINIIIRIIHEKFMFSFFKSNIKFLQYIGKFNWTKYEQGLTLGAFYWSYWTTQVPGGLLAQKYGTKLVFGGTNFLAACLGLLIPSAIKWHFNAFLFLRVLQGAIMVQNIILRFMLL